MNALLTTTSLQQLVQRWLAAGQRVAGPVWVKKPVAPAAAGLVQYAYLDAPEQLTLEGFIRPANSIKEFVFPRHEVLYRYQFRGKRIELLPPDTPVVEQIILGARPCDAATLPILDHVFYWDPRDELYAQRREATTIVTLACRDYDAHCFCTSVGLDPGATQGADAILLPIADDRFEVRCLTEKGERLFAGATEETAEQGQASAGPPTQFELADVGDFLTGGYENPAWEELTRRCLGCGACAYTCPTCHCFDIVDEGNAHGGVRVRNWDACQFPLFTAHASGHNPRSVQAQRQRQRVYHKFQIYPEKFGDILCTGCGNCSRNCPVGLGILPVLKKIAAQATTAKP